MKTSEELKALKAEVESLNKKLGELTTDELKQVTGGDDPRDDPESLMKCTNPNCGYSDVWRGYYKKGEVYRCPKCKKYSFVVID